MNCLEHLSACEFKAGTWGPSHSVSLPSKVVPRPSRALPIQGQKGTKTQDSSYISPASELKKKPHVAPELQKFKKGGAAHSEINKGKGGLQWKLSCPLWTNKMSQTCSQGPWEITTPKSLPIQLTVSCQVILGQGTRLGEINRRAEVLGSEPGRGRGPSSLPVLFSFSTHWHQRQRSSGSKWGQTDPRNRDRWSLCYSLWNPTWGILIVLSICPTSGANPFLIWAVI